MKYITIIKTLSSICGIGQTTIKKTLSEYRSTGHVTSKNITRSKKQLLDKLNIIDLQGIRQKVHSFWLKRELPTLDKILKLVNDDSKIINTTRSSLHRLLITMQFTYTEIKKHSVLTEKDSLIIWRRNYLFDLRKFRSQGRPIYYLGETSIDIDDYSDAIVKLEEFNNELLSDAVVIATRKVKRLIVLHIGSDKGFHPGGMLFFESKRNTVNVHDEINGENFREWFESILPSLERNSVIVMDNAPYHSVELEETPTTSWRTQDIINWLRSKGETFDRPMLKVMLLQRVKQIKSRYNAYVIDNIAQDAGHNILRLPPYHRELNPIEFAWSILKQYVQHNNSTFKLPDANILLNESIASVTTQHWSNFIQQVIKVEDKIWEVDDIIDEMIENMEHE